MDPRNLNNNNNNYQTSSDCVSDQKVIDNVSKYLTRFLEEARKSNFPILSKITDDLAARIWITACQFIDKQLENERAVNITQLGTFSFSSKRLDIGNNKHIIVQRPVFLFSERLAQIHGITYTKHHVSGEIPVVKMNFTAIAIAMGSERDLIEGAIREILQALSRVIATREPINFVFYNIGYLVVRDFRARVKFTPDFIKRMDGTGQLSRMIQKKKAKKSAKKSSGTSENQDNNTSEAQLKLPQPKLSQDQVRLMSPIKKQGQRSAKLNDSLDDLLEDIKPNSTAGAISQSMKLPEIDNKNGPAKATIYSSADDLKTLQHPNYKLNRNKTSIDRLTLEPEAETTRIQSAKSVASSSCTINSTEHRLKQFLASDQNVDILNNLSYVAYQRKMMNEDRRNREALADSVLQKYQDSIDREKLKQESDFKEKQRELAKKVAAFNLETQEHHELDRNQSKNQRLGEQAKAYIFQRRPLTPARFQKQANYSSALGEQVTEKSEKKIFETTELARNEKEEQLAIRDEIQSMYNANVDSLKKNRKAYRKALDSQIRVKSHIDKEAANQEELAQPSALLEPNVPYFGKNDMNAIRRKEEKDRARAVFKAQLKMASDKRKRAIKAHLAEQEMESQVLRRTKTDLIQESIDNYQSSFNRRQNLERNWIRHAAEKRQREKEYNDFMKSDRNLHEKEAELHDKYAVMFKPKPCSVLTSGRFKSNIWRESRYIPGSRLIM